MKSRRLIKAALLAMCLTGAAAASTSRTNLGALPDGDFGIVGNAAALSQSFQDTVRSSKTVVKEGALTLGRHAFADLTPGSYTAAVFGPARNAGANSAVYRASVAAVPEIETWLMLLVGLGLAGYQLHRKQKALGQQVLSDEAMSSA